MELVVECTGSEGIRIAIRQDGRELGRAYLYILRNELHDKPFGFMEDVFVDEEARGQGIGTLLVREVISQARLSGCYKLIATSRHSRKGVHKFYRRLGFSEWGAEFRIDF